MKIKLRNSFEILDKKKNIRYTYDCKENNFTGGVFVMKSRKHNEYLSEKENQLERIVNLSLLYDFYGALLKENKRRVFEDYILNDYSLSEIAETEGISRQGVYDTVKRCTKELETYEEKLQLIDKFNKTKEKIYQIRTLADEIEVNGIEQQEKVLMIEKISNSILEEF